MIRTARPQRAAPLARLSALALLGSCAAEPSAPATPAQHDAGATADPPALVDASAAGDGPRASDGAAPPAQSRPVGDGGLASCAEIADRFAALTGDPRRRICVEEVADEATWASISWPEVGPDLVRSTKFFLPRPHAPVIPTAYLDAHAFVPQATSGSATAMPWHMLFASIALPSNVPPMARYWGPDRIATAGDLAEIRVAGVGTVYGYTLHGAFSCDEHRQIHAEIARTFRLRPLYISAFGLIGKLALPPGCDVPAIVLR